MIQIRGSLDSFIHDSRLFFRNAQYVHIVAAVCMFGTGIAGAVLSDGSDGSAQVPYFFTAFIAGAWHIVFTVVCQLCIYYLSEDGSRASKAGTLVRFYSIVSSVFVLFNVMGVVFTVVNGICIEDMMCYYDKNHMSNRMMAILLILEHCLSILASVFLAKRTHLIDSELSADVAIRLNHHFDFLRIRATNHSSGSAQQSESTRSQQTTPSHSNNKNEPALSEVHSKGGHVLTTIEISAMAHKKTHRRSKSQPNMVKELDLKPPEIEGHVFSIYSDSEMKVNGENRKKKRRFIPRKTKGNRIRATIEIKTEGKYPPKSNRNGSDYSFSEDESLSSFGTPRVSVKEREQQLRKTTEPPSAVDRAEADDIFHVQPTPGIEQFNRQEEMLERQAHLQKEQEKLFKKQRKLFQVQQQQVEATLEDPAPPSYESLVSLEQTEPENNGTILQVEAAENNGYQDISL